MKYDLNFGKLAYNLRKSSPQSAKFEKLANQLIEFSGLSGGLTEVISRLTEVQVVLEGSSRKWRRPCPSLAEGPNKNIKIEIDRGH